MCMYIMIEWRVMLCCAVRMRNFDCCWLEMTEVNASTEYRLIEDRGKLHIMKEPYGSNHDEL